MTRTQAEAILAFAESGMSVSVAAKKLYRSYSGLQSILKKIRKDMGWNPWNFYDLCYLVGIAHQRVGTNKHSHEMGCK